MSKTRMTASDRLAAEAERYLDVVERFAALGADPHAGARAQAARARSNEQAARHSGARPGRRRPFG